MRIQGSSALVVGGASGLGEATSRRLSEQGAALTISDVDAEKGEALATELGTQWWRPMSVRTTKTAVDAATGREGGLRVG